MENNTASINLSNVRTKIRTYTEQGNDVLYSAIFITGKEKIKLVDRAPIKQLSLVTKNLKYESPDRIRIELFNGKEAVNHLWFTDIIVNKSMPEKETSEFKGLGEAQINELVDERFKQRERNILLEELKERVNELTQENEELQDSVASLESENYKISQELEGKKQIRYYAGMLGDIFESFGISKDRIKRPIAELMGISDQKSEDHIIENRPSDASGIIDSSFKDEIITDEDKKRGEIISLISEYLNTTNNQTLANVFSIFSEIEADSSIAGKITSFITTLKKQNHENI